MVLGGREVVWLEQKGGVGGLGDPLGVMEYIHRCESGQPLASAVFLQRGTLDPCMGLGRGL